MLSFERSQSNQYQSRDRLYSGEYAPSFATKMYWVAEFKRDGTSCQEEYCSGRLNEVTMTEIVKKIHKIVLDDCRLKVHELADMVEISKSAINSVKKVPRIGQ